MSKMRTDRKPPLARSSMSIRPLRVLQSNPTPPQSPPGSMARLQTPNRDWNMKEESDLHPKYHTISWEMRALTKMVNQELGNVAASDARNKGSVDASLNCDLLFERGKLYDEYSARRNERLKRKKYGGDRKADIVSKSTPYKLGVTAKSTKTKKTVKKTISAAFVGETNTVVAAGTPRYSLRSISKENKKPPLPLPEKPKSLVGLECERKAALRRVRRL